MRVVTLLRNLESEQAASGTSDLCAVAKRCGGCPQIGQAPQLTLELKGERLVEQFRRADCLAPQIELFRESSALGYRNRIRLRVFADGSFGFFNEHKDHACAALVPELRILLGRVQAQLAHARQALELCSHLELRAPDADGRAGLFLAPDPKKSTTEGMRRDAQSSIKAALQDLPLLISGLDPATHAEQRFLLTDRSYQYVPLDGFMQVNHPINRAMISWLLELSHAYSVERVLDLYCGSGNFIIPLLAAGCRGVGVEVNEASVLAARRAVLEQDLEGELVVAPVDVWARQTNDNELFDLVIVDAPRAGLRDAVQDVADLESPRILLFSCNPESLVRDVRALVDRGYRSEHMRAFDMFAYTNHLEVGVMLQLHR